jgi:UDP-N-acetylmuramate--alanine ligase
MSAAGPWAGRRLHIVAIGGAGMSGLAVVAAQLGAQVTGSDRAESPYLEQVRAAGIDPVIGHDAANVPPGDDVELVFSTAVPADNPERAVARERGLAELHRSALLTQLSELRRTIAITGTHGKTTTTAMTVHVLRACGLDPAFLVGARLRPGGENAGWGAGEWLVAEADESDRSLLSFRREVAVLLNADLDHHATYGSRLDLDATLVNFLAPAAHAVVWDRPELLALAQRAGVADVTAFDVTEEGAELTAGGSRFDWRGSEVVLAVPGIHNARNAVAALEACRLAGADPAAAAAALAGFPGTARRFEARGRTPSGALVYDDYAHHPAEVAATLAAARTLEPSRLVAVFQPHLYSRTAALAREFGAALAAADLVCVLDVYPARERAEDFPGVGGLLVAEAAADAADGRRVCWLPALDDAERFLAAELREGDVCLTLGAGDVDGLAARLTA